MTDGRAKRVLLIVLCALGVLLFSTLGIWQVERRVWKLDLIERVGQRVRAPAVAAPGPAAWSSLRPDEVEYRHVRTRGVFLPGKVVLVDALTERGSGYWVVTPLDTGDATILINRGFVPADRAGPARRASNAPAGIVAVDGLLRLTEPHGRFLRANDPAGDRWYSRDVGAMAAARGLHRVAPYFIDAGAAPDPGGLPIGGLTVVRFRNAHLWYAITWFGLALLSLAGLVLVAKGAQEAG